MFSHGAMIVLEVTEPKEQQDQKNCRVSWPRPPNAGVLSGNISALLVIRLEDVWRGSAHLPADVARSSPQLREAAAMNRRTQ